MLGLSSPPSDPTSTDTPPGEANASGAAAASVAPSAACGSTGFTATPAIDPRRAARAAARWEEREKGESLEGEGEDSADAGVAAAGRGADVGGPPEVEDTEAGPRGEETPPEPMRRRAG